MPQLCFMIFGAVQISVCMYVCSAVVQRVERWTCNQQVVGSNHTRGKAA